MTEFITRPLPEGQPNLVGEDIRKEQDFIVDKIDIIAFNGAVYGVDHVRSVLNIYSDLYNTCLSGTLEFVDSVDLPGMLPIIGEEIIKVSFTRPDERGRGRLKESVKASFRVFQMENRRPNQNDKMQTYILHFVSADFIKNKKIRIQRSFKGMPYSDMVDKIFQDLQSKKPIVIEPTMFEHDYCIANQTIFEACKMLGSISISAEGGGSSYLFYEDIEQYNYVTMSKLMEGPTVQTYGFQTANVTKTADGLNRNIEEDVFSAQDFSFSGTFDVINNMSRGMYAQQLITFDPVRQLYKVEEFDYLKEFKSFKHVDKHELCTPGLDALGSPKTVMKLMTTTKDHDKIPWIVAHEPGIKPNHVEEYVMHRASQIQQVNNAKIVLTVTGDPRRKVGQVIEFKMPNMTGAFDKNHPLDPPHDRFLSGRYLIVSLRHQVSKTHFTNEMEIIKDTLLAKIYHTDPIKSTDWTW